MKKRITQLQNQLNLLGDLTKIKVSLLLFSSWSYDPQLAALLSKRVIDRLTKISTTRGRLAAVDELKAARLAVTRWLCGRPLKGKVGAPIFRSGLPKLLGKDICAILCTDRPLPLIKLILSVLSVSRYFKGGKPIDLQAITAPSNPILPEEGEILLGLDKLGIGRQQPRPSEWKFKWITTAGPNGTSITSSLQDLPRFNELFRSQVDTILPGLLPYIDKCLLFESKFGLSHLMGLDRNRDDSLRKLSIKEDRECKSRIFAIFDYWSQTLLTPLHDWSFKTLRKIPQDCTFNQVEGVSKIRDLRSRKHYYSYDLKSATDRFPVKFQEVVLSLIFDSDYAKAWREVMTREPFRLEGQDPIRWEAGQPLGAKSSWGVFTICHHLVVHIAAIRTNSDAHYVILGDDIVLRGRALATEYRRIMHLLGVQISDQKSHVSKDTFEFAKNWSHQGRNASGYPVVGIAETLNKPLELAAVLLFQVPEKGYLHHICSRSVSQFMTPLATYSTEPRRFAIYMANQTAWYYSFLSWLVTRESGWAKYLVQSAGLVVSPTLADRIITETVCSKWENQLEKTLNDFQDFGFDLLEKISKLAPFKSTWDPKAWPGRMSAVGIEFNANARSVPVLGALQEESRVEYSDYIQRIMEGESLTIDDVEKLKLSPKPQLKGFLPQRQKENIRTLKLVTAGFNQAVTRKSIGIRGDAYSLST